MKTSGDKSLIKVLYLQLKELIKKFPLISNIDTIDIEIDDKEKCSTYFIRLGIKISEFEKGIPPYRKHKWEIFKNREIRINGGLFLYTGELGKWNDNLKHNSYYEIAFAVDEILEYVGYPVCKNAPGLVSYVLIN